MDVYKFSVYSMALCIKWMLEAWLEYVTVPKDVLDMDGWELPEVSALKGGE